MLLGNGQRFVFKMVKSGRVKDDTFARYLFASHFTADKVVLDAACGSGFGTFFLAQEAKTVWGIDFFSEAIDFAKQNYSRENINFLVDDLLKMELPQNFFDVIISFHTIEQTEQPVAILNNFYHALKDDGVLIISTPNKKIVSPYSPKPIGEFHKFEFYKIDLEKMFKDKFNIKWYGQRCTSKLLTPYFVRRFIRLLEILLNKRLGFYGAREKYEVTPLKFFYEPKDFVIVLTKKIL